MKKKSAVKHKPICQKTINKAGGALILRHSGNYALTEDVTGTIVLASNSICLDLCCHTLSAGGRPNAVVTSGYQDLKVFNGRIINASDAAILVTKSTAVELYSLVMSNNSLDAIRETTCTDVSVHDVDFINNNNGERALLFDTCNNISVNRCNASGFLSTIGSVIQLDSCHSASLQDVDVTFNTKTAAADIDEFTAGTAFVAVTESDGIDFVHVRVNNNTFNNNIPVADQNNQWRTAEAIAFFSSNSSSLSRCETCNNTDVAGNAATTDTEDYMLCLIFCDSCIVTEHKSNNNSCTQPIFYFVAIGCLDSTNNVFEGCQANSNVAAELSVVPGLECVMVPMWIAQYFDFALSNDNVLSNCQANFNTVTVGGAGRTNTATGGFIEAILVGGTNSIVDNCQANNTTMGDNQPFTAAAGIVSLGANVKIVDSIGDNNFGGAQSFGINLIFSTLGNEGPNPQISNCSASSNGNYGIVIGFSDDLTETGGDIVITNCVCNNNGGQPGFAAGIKVEPLIPGTTNLLIKGCQIYDTFSGNSDAWGILASNATNVVIEECNIFNTTADGVGHGILFDTLTNSKIIRTQVHENQNSGIELAGDNSTIAIIECVAMDNDIGVHFAPGSTAACSLVQDSRVLSNETAGLSYEITPLTVTFIGNEAQCNGETVCDNFAGLNFLINLQELSWADGSITNENPSRSRTGSHRCPLYQHYSRSSHYLYSRDVQDGCCN